MADCGFNGAFVLELRSRIEAPNQQIAGDDRLGPQYRIGHSYLTPSGGAVHSALKKLAPLQASGLSQPKL